MKYAGLVALALSILCLSWCAYSALYATPKRSCYYVMMPAIMKQYKGAIDASIRLRKKQQASQANVDSMIARINIGSKEEVFKRREEIQRYVEVAERQQMEEQEAAGKEVVAYVKSSCMAIARKRGYPVIIAVTDEDFILHGENGLDITNEILEHLQTTYRNELRN